MRKFYVTTPIYYPNSKLHIGHAYTTTMADYIARYKKNNNYEVFFLTGSDEHGQKIADSASSHGKQPKEYVDEIVKSFKDLWTNLGVEYSQFIRTTDERHMHYVQNVFQKLYDKGYIYKGEYQGYYCKPDEAFFTKTQLVDGKCPTCGREVQYVSEDSYFLKVTAFKDFITEALKHKNILIPQHRTTELINSFIENGFTDLSITRTNFSWGVPIPKAIADKHNDGKHHVIYVWFDAFLNYLSAFTYNNSKWNLEQVWGKNSDVEILQLVGKEITRFHSIYLPIVLEMLGLKSNFCLAHGFILSGEEKMSKSLGNVIDPNALIEKHGRDALRWYLMHNIHTGNDGTFTDDLFKASINGSLVNKYSNLVNRTSTIVHKSFNSIVPAKKVVVAEEKALFTQLDAFEKRFHEEMNSYKFSDSTKTLMEYADALNKFIDTTTPWSKSEEEKASIMNILVNRIARLNLLLNPILIDSTQKFFASLNMTMKDVLHYPYKDYANTEMEKIDFLFTRIQ